jgi:hypothetical protein
MVAEGQFFKFHGDSRADISRLRHEEEPSFTTESQNKAEAVFASRKDQPDFLDYEFKVYKGTVLSDDFVATGP